MVTYQPEFARPDLPVPLTPVRGCAGFALRYLLGLRGPSFTAAFRDTLGWAAAGVVLAGLSLPLQMPWQWVVVACSAVIGLFVIVRALGLLALEPRQRTFEQGWIAAQSEVLRQHAFDILRFTVHDLMSEGQGAQRAYDLTRTDDIRDLIRVWNQERSRQDQASRVTVEFSYLTADGVSAVAVVHRELPGLVFLEGWAGQHRSLIRFPEAQYISRPGRGEHRAKRTDWVLSGPAMILVSDPVYDETVGPELTPEAPTGIPGLGSAR